MILISCSFTPACGGNEKEGFEQLNGVLVADEGVVVALDRHWRTRGDRGGYFTKHASLFVSVREESIEGLSVDFIARGKTRRFHFVVSWDGEPLWDEPRTARGETLHADVDASMLSLGMHRLTIERLIEPDESDRRKTSRNVFDEISVRRNHGGPQSLQQITPNQFLARFLEFGVTSRTPSKLSGCFFLGPQSHTIEVAGARDGKASFIVENHSRSAARFNIQIDDRAPLGFEVDPGVPFLVRSAIPAGRHDVTLEVEGESDGCFLWGAPHLQRGSGLRGPPVVLITLDTTRRDVIPPLSGRPELAPNLARFADSGTVYLNAYSTAPWTLPSHASIFTGLYPSHHRAGVADDVLNDSWTTLAEAFRDSGYRTAGFAGGSVAASDFGMAQGFSLYRDPERIEETADVITDAAIDFITNDLGSPLFLFLNYFDPHHPYDAPEVFRRRTGVDVLGGRLIGTPGWADYVQDKEHSWGPIRWGKVAATEEGLEYLRARYEAEVAFMDHQIGRLFAALRDHGLYDEALIVVVADHGEFLGEGGLFVHSYRLDRELTAVPLLIKWPRQETGEVVEELVSQVDLYPTIAAAAEIAVPNSDGVEFGRGRTDALGNRRSVFLEEHESRVHPLRARFKIASHVFGLQRYDTREVFFPGSIDCSRRVGDEWFGAQCPTTWEDRLGSLPPRMRSSLDLETGFSESDIDDDFVEKLRALGYVE